MQIVLSDKRTYISTIEFRNTIPIVNIERLRSFKEEGVTGNFIKKEFRYSFDNNIWSPWQTLNSTNFTSISFLDQQHFYIHIKYTRSGVISGNINSFYITYDSASITHISPLDSSVIDADTLQGEDGAYYLNREHQFGPYSDLIVENVSADPSASGVYHSRIDTSLGTTLYFKKINVETGLTIAESSSGIITIGADASISSGGTYNSTLDPTVEMVSPVGGFPAGTSVADINGESISLLWDTLLFPTGHPTLTGPSATFAMSPSTTIYEVSSNVSLTFTTTLNRGSISPQYAADSPYRSGLPSNFNFTGFGLVDISSSAIPYVAPTFNVSIGLGTQSWSAAVSYQEGTQPYDSKGSPFDSSLAPGTISASPTRTIEGVYPYFATTSSISVLTKQPLISMSVPVVPGNTSDINSGFLLVTENGVDRQKIEIPTIRGTVTGIKYFNTNNNSWEYELGNAALSLTRWIISSVTETIQGYVVNYTRYTYNGPQRGQISIRLEF